MGSYKTYCETQGARNSHFQTNFILFPDKGDLKLCRGSPVAIFTLSYCIAGCLLSAYVKKVE